MSLDDQSEALLSTTKFLAPPPGTTVSEWADHNMWLSPEASARRGQWTTLPYQREPMDCLSINHPCDRVVLECASQTMKTAIALCWLGYIIDVDPGPVLFVEHRIEDAKTLSKDRVDPMLRDCTALQGKVSPPRSRDGDNSILHKGFVGGHVTFTGSISPSGLAMRPIRYLFLDEVDRYEAAIGQGGKEGDPVSLAIRRTDTYELNRKILIASTPTIKGASRIHQAFLLSDQRRYFVPCPFCAHEQTLVFPQLKWPEGDTDSTVYECISCHKYIPHHLKPLMMEKGRWVAGNPNSRTPGFHLNQLYSLLKSWKVVAEDFLEAAKSPESLKTFKNTVEAELWEERHEMKMDEHALMVRRESYTSSPIPLGPVIITAGVDVQDNRLEMEIVGWGRGEESWSLAYYEILGTTSHAAVWEKLDEILKQPLETEEDIPLRIHACCIDSGGHSTAAVYRFTRERYNRRIYATKGKEGKRPIWPKKPSRNTKDGSPLFIVGVDSAKEYFYNRLKLEEQGPGYCHFPMERNIDYFEQLTSERVYTKYKNGFPIKEWRKDPSQANEALDTRILAIAALESLKASGMKLEREVTKYQEMAAVRERVLAEAKAAGTPPPAFTKPAPAQRTVVQSKFMNR